MDDVEIIREQLEQANKKITFLEKRILSYEGNGPAKLYYSLNRKQWEMADLMNRENLTDMDIDDPKSKTFDRLKIILKEGSEMGVAVNSLGIALGITGNEEEDVKKKRQRTTPESIAEEIGDNKKSDV
jgi:hypothetical protein